MQNGQPPSDGRASVASVGLGSGTVTGGGAYPLGSAGYPVGQQQGQMNPGTPLAPQHPQGPGQGMGGKPQPGNGYPQGQPQMPMGLGPPPGVPPGGPMPGNMGNVGFGHHPPSSYHPVRTVIGDYVLGPVINEGSYGIVRQAQKVSELSDSSKPLEEKLFAMKVIQTAKHCESEVAIQHALQHTNILKIIDCFSHEGLVFLVLQFCPGGDLFDFVQHYRAPIPEDTCLNYFKQMLGAVLYCHRRGIVHHDIKLENFLLSGDRNLLRLCDFGAAEEVGVDGLTARYKGEVSAPEKQEGCTYNGFKADVFQLGKALHELLFCLRPPSPNGDIDPPPIPGFVAPVVVCDLIRHMINPDPALRPDLEVVSSHPWFQGAQQLPKHHVQAQYPSQHQHHPHQQQPHLQSQPQPHMQPQHPQQPLHQQQLHPSHLYGAGQAGAQQPYLQSYAPAHSNHIDAHPTDYYGSAHGAQPNEGTMHHMQQPGVTGIQGTRLGSPAGQMNPRSSSPIPPAYAPRPDSRSGSPALGHPTRGMMGGQVHSTVSQLNPNPGSRLSGGSLQKEELDPDLLQLFHYEAGSSSAASSVGPSNPSSRAPSEGTRTPTPRAFLNRTRSASPYVTTRTQKNPYTVADPATFATSSRSPSPNPSHRPQRDNGEVFARERSSTPNGLSLPDRSSPVMGQSRGRPSGEYATHTPALPNRARTPSANTTRGYPHSQGSSTGRNNWPSWNPGQQRSDSSTPPPPALPQRGSVPDHDLETGRRSGATGANPREDPRSGSYGSRGSMTYGSGSRY